MEKLSLKTSFLALSILMASNTAVAQNPIVTHCYTADPAPMVFEGNDSLYVYCDEDMNIPGVHDFYYMDRYRVYSTVDMVNWTDHGIAMPRTAFAWAREGTCWASQCVERRHLLLVYMSLKAKRLASLYRRGQKRQAFWPIQGCTQAAYSGHR